MVVSRVVRYLLGLVVVVGQGVTGYEVGSGCAGFVVTVVVGTGCCGEVVGCPGVGGMDVGDTPGCDQVGGVDCGGVVSDDDGVGCGGVDCGGVVCGGVLCGVDDVLVGAGASPPEASAIVGTAIPIPPSTTAPATITSRLRTTAPRIGGVR